MNNMKTIRDSLGVTQVALAEALGCTQGNVSFYEKGQMVPPDAARRLIAYAKTLGHDITFDDIYGATTAPPAAAKPIALKPPHPVPLEELLAQTEQERRTRERERSEKERRENDRRAKAAAEALQSKDAKPATGI